MNLPDASTSLREVLTVETEGGEMIDSQKVVINIRVVVRSLGKGGV